MFSKTNITLSGAIILSAAFSASAATTHHASHTKRSAIYNSVPGYNAPRAPLAYSGFVDPDPFGMKWLR
jgi:hypothetical protein